MHNQDPQMLTHTRLGEFGIKIYSRLIQGKTKWCLKQTNMVKLEQAGRHEQICGTEGEGERETPGNS